jgi:5-methylcytosine-specific restriction protein A
MRRGHVTPNCRTVDHIVNKARGGGDNDENLQTICDGPGSCHQAKTAAESRGQVWDEVVPVTIGLDGWPT